MSDSLDGATISGALQNKEEMRRWMRAVNRNVLLHRNMLDGGFEFADDPSAQLTVLAPPPPIKFSVIGTDGQFQVTITLPQDVTPPSVTLLKNKIIAASNQLGVSMVHQLQSAANVNFDAAAGVQTYGPFSELTQTFQLPNQTLFWRIRSSFDGSNWNSWQIYSSATTCGPIGVSSGFLRSTSGAANSSTNTLNNATVDSVDAGGSATVRIYGPGGVGSSWIRFDGQNGQTAVSAGTVAGMSYSTAYVVVYSSATGYQAFLKTTQYTNALPDNLYFAGIVTTVASGGGGGSSGGGGSNPGNGGCPLSGAPVRLFGHAEWWSKRVVPCHAFRLIVTERGRIGIFSRKDRRYCDRGLIAVENWEPGFMALTEDGEERVTVAQDLNLPGATVDSYEGKEGHVYSAWGFIGHNFKAYL
jgi:hypothetical protein